MVPFERSDGSNLKKIAWAEIPEVNTYTYDLHSRLSGCNNPPGKQPVENDERPAKMPQEHEERF